MSKPVLMIVGFDVAGNAVEVATCEPANPIAEQIIASYMGPLVNLHFLPREVDETLVGVSLPHFDVAGNYTPIEPDPSERTTEPPPAPAAEPQMPDVVIEDWAETEPPKKIPWPP